MRYFLSLLFLTSVFVTPVWATQSQLTPQNYVEDIAGVLSASQETQLNQQIKQVETDTKAQIAVLLIESTGGQAISKYTVDVGQQWGVGNKDDDNGLMIVVATKDRDWFAATGYGLEGILPDLLINRMGRTFFPPHFKNGDYATGLKLFIAETDKLIKADPQTTARWEDAKSPLSFPAIDETKLLFVLAGAFILGILFFLPSKHKIEFIQRLGGAIFVVIHFLILGGSLIFSMGLLVGLLVFLFYTIFPLSMILFGPTKGNGSGWASGSGWSSGSRFSSSSSGFGGFGGGSFGGGGSGGSW